MPTQTEDSSHWRCPTSRHSAKTMKENSLPWIRLSYSLQLPREKHCFFVFFCHSCQYSTSENVSPAQKINQSWWLSSERRNSCVFGRCNILLSTLSELKCHAPHKSCSCQKFCHKKRAERYLPWASSTTLASACKSQQNSNSSGTIKTSSLAVHLVPLMWKILSRNMRLINHIQMWLGMGWQNASAVGTERTKRVAWLWLNVSHLRERGGKKARAGSNHKDDLLGYPPAKHITLDNDLTLFVS